MSTRSLQRDCVAVSRCEFRRRAVPARAAILPGPAGCDERNCAGSCPGGRVSLNVWGSIERLAAFVDACAEFLGPETRATFDLNFSLNTSEELHRLASDAGLKGAKVRFEHRTMRAPDAAEYGVWVLFRPALSQGNSSRCLRRTNSALPRPLPSSSRHTLMMPEWRFRRKTISCLRIASPSYSPHSRDSLTGMVQPPGIA